MVFFIIKIWLRFYPENLHYLVLIIPIFSFLIKLGNVYVICMNVCEWMFVPYLWVLLYSLWTKKWLYSGIKCIKIMIGEITWKYITLIDNSPKSLKWWLKIKIHTVTGYTKKLFWKHFMVISWHDNNLCLYHIVYINNTKRRLPITWFISTMLTQFL